MTLARHTAAAEVSRTGRSARGHITHPAALHPPAVERLLCDAIPAAEVLYLPPVSIAFKTAMRWSFPGGSALLPHALPTTRGGLADSCASSQGTGQIHTRVPITWTSTGLGAMYTPIVNTL